MNEFTNRQKVKMPIWKLISIICFVTIVSVTLAFFSSDDFASKFLGISGKVRITAVGKGTEYADIEDTDTLCKLNIELDRGYDVFIPNMPVSAIVNCKVTRSTTKPLLRAFFNMSVIDMDTGLEDTENADIFSSIQSQLHDIITKDNDWYFHTDGYYYYAIDASSNLGGNTVLKEIDATSSDAIVPFIDESFIFPSSVTSDYSGLGIKISITFQAIQNYIPDDNGQKLPNTITNSLKIFNNFTPLTDYVIPTLENFTFTIKNNQATLKLSSTSSLRGNIILPDATADGTPITSIDASVFKGNTSISNVVFPSSYTSIPQRAFESSSLISVDLSQTQITEIPDYAFYKANLSSINLPEGLIRIGKYAFYQSTLPSITLPGSLQTIDNWALFDGKLKSIYIPRNVNNIGICMLYSPNLQQIIVDEDNATFYDIDDKVLASYSGDLILMATQCGLKSYTISDNITTIKERSLYYVSTLKTLNIGSSLATIESTSLPRYLETISVDANNANFVSENNNTLYNKAKTKLYLATSTITNFIMPENLTISDNEVFVPARNSLKYVTLNKTVSNIAFLKECRKILSISVPAENTNFKVDDRAIFSADGKTIIKYFGGNSATTYTVPDGVTKIYQYCFYNSTLQSVALPDGLTEIGIQSFYACTSLSSINIPDSVTNFGSYAFSSGNRLTSFVVSSNITTISSYLLSGAKYLTNIEFYNTTIPSSTCYGCTSLKTVIVGSNVTSIGAQVFQNCTSLESVEFQGTTPPTLASANAFLNTNNTFKIYVPDSAVSAYKTAQYFSQYASQIYPMSSRA